MSHKDSTKLLHMKRIKAVTDYIGRHINDPFCCNLNLEALAKSVHTSHYHLSRIFRQYMNETIHQYIKRRRLESAALQLSNNDNSIQHIARLCTYNSLPAFTKAFKQFHGCCPREYREKQTPPACS